jgi:hypothetical protein
LQLTKPLVSKPTQVLPKLFWASYQQLVLHKSSHFNQIPINLPELSRREPFRLKPHQVNAEVRINNSQHIEGFP